MKKRVCEWEKSLTFFLRGTCPILSQQKQAHYLGWVSNAALWPEQYRSAFYERFSRENGDSSLRPQSHPIIWPCNVRRVSLSTSQALTLPKGVKSLIGVLSGPLSCNNSLWTLQECRFSLDIIFGCKSFGLFAVVTLVFREGEGTSESNSGRMMF